MLEKSLLDIAKRAAQRTYVPHSARSVAAVSEGLLAKNVQRMFTDCAPAQRHSLGASLIDKYNSEYDVTSNVVALEDRLSKAGTGHLTTRQDILERLQSVPFSDAMEAVGVLLRAGATEDAVQLISWWNENGDESSLVSIHSRKNASAQLADTINSLMRLNDAQSLRVTADVLGAAFDEQALGVDMSSNCCTGRSRRKRVVDSAFKLLVPLGVKRLFLGYVLAVEAICKLPDSTGITLEERVQWLSKASSAFDKLSGTTSAVVNRPALPQRLQSVYEKTVECAEGYSEERVSRVSSQLLRSFRHPSQYEAASLLAMPMSEIKSLKNSLDAQPSSELLKHEHSFAKQWTDLVQRFLPHSSPLQNAQVAKQLIYAIADQNPRTAKKVETELSLARQSLCRSLTTSQAAERRRVSVALLSRPCVMKKLRLSPCAVLAVYGDSFHTVGHINPKFSRACLRAIPVLMKRRRETVVARLAWNHLSTECPEGIALLKRFPHSYDLATAAVCRTLRKEAKSKSAKKWMGHRSLALLRVATKADVATPVHAIVTCASALDVGVHFASVSETVKKIYGTDENMEKFVVNMIRLCAESQNEPIPVRTLKDCFGGAVGKYFQSLALPVFASRQNTKAPTACYLPSRSKQLALWALANDHKASPTFVALAAALFVDPIAREAFLNCDAFLDAPDSTCRTESSPRREFDIASTIHQALSWEVAASVACNCTNDVVYQRILKALGDRAPTDVQADILKVTTSFGLNGREKVDQLLSSEIDSYTECYCRAGSSQSAVQ